MDKNGIYSFGLNSGDCKYLSIISSQETNERLGLDKLTTSAFPIFGSLDLCLVFVCWNQLECVLNRTRFRLIKSTINYVIVEKLSFWQYCKLAEYNRFENGIRITKSRNEWRLAYALDSSLFGHFSIGKLGFQRVMTDFHGKTNFFKSIVCEFYFTKRKEKLFKVVIGKSNAEATMWIRNWK